MRAAFTFSSGSMAAKTSSAARTVSTESKSASLSSCRSRLYDEGKPFNVVRIDNRFP